MYFTYFVDFIAVNLISNTSRYFIVFRYLRMKIDEVNEEMSASSVCRMTTFNKYKPPKSKQDVINMLSDTSNCDYPVFRDSPSDYVKTIAVGECLKICYCIVIEFSEISWVWLLLCLSYL